jgi:hypothetical protein
VNKFWKTVLWLAPILSTFEGVEHYVVSTISIILMTLKHELSFSTLLNPCWDYLMGTISILIGIAVKKVGDQIGK